MIKLENCSYSYNKINAFRDINFEIASSEVLCICGKNGSGKSTLLQVLAGILELDTGKIYKEDRSAILFQEPDIQLLGQNVLEEVLLVFPNPSSEQEKKAKELLMRFDLWEKRENLISALSFGEKRKLAFASALVEEPSLLLLDEPSAGLDYPAEKELVEIIEENKESNITQIIATHDLEFCIPYVDKVLLLDKGEQVFFGEKSKALDYIKNNAQIGIRLPR